MIIILKIIENNLLKNKLEYFNKIIDILEIIRYVLCLVPNQESKNVNIKNQLMNICERVFEFNYIFFNLEFIF
jgi:hypothetical protein